MSKPHIQRFVAQVRDKELIFELGHLAGQAGGAVILRVGGSMMLATATAADQAREGADFFPLNVDFEERLYAAGRIPGSFFRREGRPTDEATLMARLVDRALRPLFDKHARNDVHVVLTALSSDAENQLDVMAINAASAAMMISDIPWPGPVAAVRIGLIDDQLVVNPVASEMAKSQLDLRVAGTEDAILMVEAGASEVSEKRLLEALRLAYQEIQPVIVVLKEMAGAAGKPKRAFQVTVRDEEMQREAAAWLEGKFEPLLDNPYASKKAREEALDALRAELEAAFNAEERGITRDVRTAFDEELKLVMRRRILAKGIRADLRDTTTVRPIWCDIGLLPRTHGSAVFTRGETQVLTITTLGTPREEQTLDTLSIQETKRYMHHYNFPPYSTGEAGFMRGPRRREIGHGALAERALLPMIPPETDFPYTLRLVSEVLSSNGSTSMAAVCGSSLSLMDAGVPIKAPVAGVAMGLVKEGERYAVLTDILGMEDALGDMDFKVAGTAEGITALQMDIKIKGLGFEIFERALAQAREARLHILEKMLEALPAPRPELSKYAPAILTIHIDPEKIGKIIGPGGKVIRALQDETHTRIEVAQDGTVYVAAVDQGSGAEAIARIEALVEEPTVGRIYTGRVVRTTDFGAFVEILPGTDGMVHISQLADYRVPRVEDVAKVGDEIMVMVIDIDHEGKIRLSRQAVLEGWTPEQAREHNRRPQGGRRGGDDRARRSDSRSRDRGRGN